MEKDFCPACGHHIVLHDLFRGCMDMNCSCKKTREQIEHLKLEKENDDLRKQFQDMREAAEFWNKKYEELFTMCSEQNEKENIALERLDKKVTIIMKNYELMYSTLKGIVDDFANPNMTYFNVFSRAFSCLYEVAKNNEEKV